MSLEVHRYKILGAAFSTSMDYLYTVDGGSNIYVWKWVQENLTESYKNLKEAKIRRRNQRRGQAGNHIKSEVKGEDEINEELLEEQEK